VSDFRGMWRSPHRKHRARMVVSGKRDKSSPPLFLFDWFAPRAGTSSKPAGGGSPGKKFQPLGKRRSPVTIPDKRKIRVAVKR
jgi:hypothetical protein